MKNKFILSLLSIILAFSAIHASGAGEKVPLTPVADGSVLLHSRDVTIHGKNVRYEPQTNKNTIGYMTKVEDWVSWDFEITKPSRYTLAVKPKVKPGMAVMDLRQVLLWPVPKN